MEGDREAFETLYLRHHAAVAAVCRRWLRDEQLAEDAAQETFLRAWMALPHYRPTGDFRSWLRRIARNHCHDLWRAQHDRTVTEIPTDVHTVYLDDPTAAMPDTADSAAEQLAMRALLQRLRRRDAVILLEHHAFGLPVLALARRWELTRGAMEVALHRARARARRVAKEQGLRGLVPVGMIQRLLAWSQRLGVEMGAASPGLAAVLYPMAIAVAIALPPSPPGSPAALESITAAPTRHAPSAESRQTPAEAMTARRPASAPTTRDRNPPDAKRRHRPPDESTHTTVVDPIPVPGTSRTITASDSPPPSISTIGVRNPVRGGYVATFGVGKDDGRHERDLHAQLCPVAQRGEPVTFCESR